MKLFLAILISFTLSFNGKCQSDFIKIETNKTIGLFSFLETSSGQLGTSSSFRDLILESYKNDQEFKHIISSYSSLHLDSSLKREGYPDKRASYTTVKDLLWIMASNATSIDDLSERIIGLLPHNTHILFINLLRSSEPYYDNLVWNMEQENISRIHNQLGHYKGQISDLYLSISKFYNTTWSTEIPFKIALYPIPLAKGFTSAIPKGNALICNFLSHNENDYINRLGIIIHEMCHILYDEQNPDFQHQIDDWFAESTSPYASLSYSFFNEGLATALGNGWAYKQIHGKLDTGDWYNNKHIDGFAKAIFPLVETYVNNEKSIDEKFVNESITLFQKTFPRATQETDILMNTLYLFANTEEESEVIEITKTIHKYFNIRYRSFSTPILSDENKEMFDKQETTKLFVIESDHTNTLNGLQNLFPDLKIQTPTNTIDILKDKNTNSTIIIINIDGIAKLDDAYKRLSSITYLEGGKNYEVR